MAEAKENMNVEYAKKILKISEEDLEISNFLYDRENYAPAIYHLQQSVEKAIKAYFVIMGFEPEKLHKPPIGHEPINQHVLKGILMYRTAYRFSNFLTTQIKPRILMKILEDNTNLILDMQGRGSEKQKFNIESEDEFKKELLELSKNEKKRFESLEKDEFVIQEMNKKDILTYLREIVLPLQSHSNKDLAPSEDFYMMMQNKLDEAKKDDEIKEYIDMCFLEAYGTNTEEYFEDCYSEIHDLYWVNLGQEHKKQLKSENIDDNLKNEFKTNTGGHTLSNNAKVFKIDEKHWKIIDEIVEKNPMSSKSLALNLLQPICNALKCNKKKIKKNKYRIRDVGTILYVYRGPKPKHISMQNFFKNTIENIEKDLLYGNSMALELMCLSLITGPHVSSTRYPKLSNEDRLRYSDYKEGLGIVDVYEILHERLKHCIDNIKKSYFMKPI